MVTEVPIEDFDSYMVASLDAHPADGQVYRLENIDNNIFTPENNLEFKVYPTLVVDEFFVETSEDLLTDETMLFLINNLGQTVFSQKITSTKERLDASNFPKGIYYISITNDEGQGIQKIIKN